MDLLIQNQSVHSGLKAPKDHSALRVQMGQWRLLL